MCILFDLKPVFRDEEFSYFFNVSKLSYLKYAESFITWFTEEE